MQESPKDRSDTGSGFLDDHPKMKWLATSRTSGVAAVAFVAIVAVLVTVILVRGNDGRDGDTGSAAPSATADPTTPTTPGKTGFGPSIADSLGREIAVPLDEQGQILPQTPPGERAPFAPGAAVPAPDGMMWQRIGATVAPFSTSDGPTRIDGRLAYGFARTPQGAALAGWQIMARMLRGVDDVREAYARQVVADPGRAETALRAVDQAPPEQSRTGKALIFPQAFSVTDYRDDFAVVRYAVPNAGGVWSIEQRSLIWQEQQWKLRDTTNPPAQRVSTLAGLTRW